MKEFNKRTLRNSLKKLPGFSPNEKSWNEIAQQISDVKLKQALNELPIHKAPEFESLKRAAIIEQDLPKTYSFPSFPKVAWRMAAAILLFGSVYYFVADKLLTKQPIFQEEMVEVYEIPESTTTADFDEIITYCEAETWICQQPEFTELKKDFMELDAAQTELSRAMESYGNDLNLIKQFNILERQKALILNDLSQFI